MKLCECGCGTPTRPARQTDTKKGYVKGQPMRFAYGHRARVVETKMHRQSGEGYLHRVLAERALGKPLPAGVHVHHVDEDPSAMRPRLVICQDAAYHKLLHYRAKIRRAGGNPNTDKFCSDCDLVKPLTEFNLCRANKANGRASVCRDCSKARWSRRARKTEAA